MRGTSAFRASTRRSSQRSTTRMAIPLKHSCTSTSPSASRGCGRCWRPSGGAECGSRREIDAGDDQRGRDQRLPAVPRPRVPEHRPRNGRLAGNHRRPPDPRRLLGRRNGGVPRPRCHRDRRRRGGAGRADRLLLQPSLHQPAARDAGGPRDRGCSRDGADQVRLWRIGGERDRGQRDRWRIISPAQAYHGSTLGTLALSGRRRSLQDPYVDYLPAYLHIPPSTPRFDPTGEAALEALDKALKEAGPETVSAFFCEPVSAAALPGYSPPDRFWHGLAERREKYGFVVCFDEIVTGIGRVGSWLAAHQLPIEPDIVTIGKGLGAGYTPLAAVLCREHIYDALAEGSAEFDLGHTWDGAPLPCAIGLAVLDYIVRHKLVDRVHDRGPALRDQVAAALKGSDIVGEVRGRGFLLGVSLVDPRDHQSFLPHEFDVATLVDDIAFERGLLVSSTHSTGDGFAGDEVLIAPAYTSSNEELDEMVVRFKDTIGAVEIAVKKKL